MEYELADGKDSGDVSRKMATISKFFWETGMYLGAIEDVTISLSVS